MRQESPYESHECSCTGESNSQGGQFRALSEGVRHDCSCQGTQEAPVPLRLFQGYWATWEHPNVDPGGNWDPYFPLTGGNRARCIR